MRRMLTDICIVLYRPRWSELSETLGSLRSAESEFRYLRILTSGNEADFAELTSTLASLGLAERARRVDRPDNLGFAGGQNHLLALSFADGADFAIVFNPDLTVGQHSISALIEFGNLYPGCLVGPELTSRSAEGDVVVDSRGIEWTRSGRHFDIDAGKVWDSRFPMDEAKEVRGLTGACLLVSRDVHVSASAATGQFFDESFIAYREDAELGVRAEQKGIRSICVPVKGFEHARAVKKASRSNSFVNQLSVQNRFIMRMVLGEYYPGIRPLVLARDLVILGACLTRERSSLEGVRSAFRQRRFSRYKGYAIARRPHSS